MINHLTCVFLMCFVCMPYGYGQTNDGPKISFSFDDGSTKSFPGYDLEIWNTMLLDHLDKHGLKAVLFVKGSGMDTPAGDQVIRSWDERGHLIGNHSYHHPYFNSDKISLELFKSELLKNDSVISKYENYTRLFRFPYLKEGNTAEKRDGFRAFLKQNAYKNGHVTIDASDWYIDGRMVKQLRDDLDSDLSPYGTFYVNHIIERALFYDSLSFELTGRRICHNLLLHHNLVAALFLDDLIMRFKEMGWEVLNVDEAYKDEVYNQEPQTIPAGESLIWALAKQSEKYENLLRYPAEDGKYEKEKLDALLGSLESKVRYETESLKIEQLSEGTFLHVSYLKTENFGNVACNGMVVIDNAEAIIIDTPTSDTASTELFRWIESQLNCKTIGVVVTHFHVDCLGGLQALHDREVPSYAYSKTIDLARSDGKAVPQNDFNHKLELKVGNKMVLLEYPGQGHTKDNIVCYVPSERVLFGGCLIKSLGASKGNLDNANTKQWSETVLKVKTAYNDADRVVPGHGKPGGKNLLNYTIRLFDDQQRPIDKHGDH